MTDTAIQLPHPNPKTVQEVKANYQSLGTKGYHFFDSDTMKFFGDTLASYALRTHNGKLYLYGKLGTQVRVFRGKAYRRRDAFQTIREVLLNGDLEFPGPEEKEAFYRDLP